MQQIKSFEVIEIKKKKKQFKQLKKLKQFEQNQCFLLLGECSAGVEGCVCACVWLISEQCSAPASSRIRTHGLHRAAIHMLQRKRIGAIVHLKSNVPCARLTCMHLPPTHTRLRSTSRKRMVGMYALLMAGMLLVAGALLNCNATSCACLHVKTKRASSPPPFFRPRLSNMRIFLKNAGLRGLPLCLVPVVASFSAWHYLRFSAWHYLLLCPQRSLVCTLSSLHSILLFARVIFKLNPFSSSSPTSRALL